MGNAMKRRDAILALAALGLAAASSRMVAQPKRPDPARLAILDEAAEATRQQLWAAFRTRLRELGYVEGRDVLIDARFAGGSRDRLPLLAAELVAGKPDVIVVVTTTVALAVKKETSTIPIVAVSPSFTATSGVAVSAPPARSEIATALSAPS